MNPKEAYFAKYAEEVRASAIKDAKISEAKAKAKAKPKKKAKPKVK